MVRDRSVRSPDRGAGATVGRSVEASSAWATLAVSVATIAVAFQPHVPDDEIADGGMSGAQLVDGGELDEVSVVKHGDMGSAAVQHGEIVAADDLGATLPDVVEEGILDRHLGLDVNTVERLVTDDHR